MKNVNDGVLSRKLDHDRFPFRPTAEVGAHACDARVIVHLVVVLQRFLVNAKAPFPLPGAPDRPYPDLGNVTQRESGLGHGLWRLADQIEMLGIPASFVVERQARPWLADVEALLRSPRHSIVAGGEHALQVHTNDMERDEERRIINRCVRDLEGWLGREVKGWRSPYCSQSSATLDLVAEAGIHYIGDFANDDRPFEIHTDGGPLVAIPMNHFYSDLHLIHGCRQSVEEYAHTTIAAAKWLASEDAPAPAVLSLAIHPWIMGVTHRVDAFVAMLDVLRKTPGVRFMNSDEIFTVSVDGARQTSGGTGA